MEELVALGEGWHTNCCKLRQKPSLCGLRLAGLPIVVSSSRCSRCPLRDEEEEDIAQYFQQAENFITAAKDAGGAVLGEVLPSAGVLPCMLPRREGVGKRGVMGGQIPVKKHLATMTAGPW